MVIESPTPPLLIDLIDSIAVPQLATIFVEKSCDDDFDFVDFQ
jgi:hypothetical protein